jgi:hypothetical protein
MNGLLFQQRSQKLEKTWILRTDALFPWGRYRYIPYEFKTIQVQTDFACFSKPGSRRLKKRAAARPLFFEEIILNTVKTGKTQ